MLLFHTLKSLRTQKGADFKLWKEIVAIKVSNKHLSDVNLQTIVNLRASLNLGLSEVLKAAFPNTIPVIRPLQPRQAVPHSEWMAGFTTGPPRSPISGSPLAEEGCFFVRVNKGRNKAGIGVPRGYRFRVQKILIRLKSIYICLKCKFNDNNSNIIQNKASTMRIKKYSTSTLITPKGMNEIVRLNTIRSFSSTSSRKSSSRNTEGSNKYNSDFFKKHYHLNESDLNNPLIIVNSFLKNASLKKEIVKQNIDLTIINAILRGLGKYELSSDEFKVLKNIKPVRFNLPLGNNDLTLLSELIGTTGQILNSKPGAYVFTNKINGYTYVGSTVSLANRLFKNYFKIVGQDNRIIIKAIKETGLENFTLDVYLIPKEWIELALSCYNKEVGCSPPEGVNNATRSSLDPLITNKAKAGYIKRMKDYYLPLEQILILEFNPSYNTLKVAYSNAGYKRTLEAVTKSALTKFKVTYLYDIKIKQLVYIAGSRSELSKISKNRSIDMYLNGKLYLNQFIYSNNPLSEEEYTTKLMNPESLSAYVDEVRIKRKRESVSKASEARKLSLKNKLIPVKLINIQTKEVTVHNSIGDAARYLQQLDPLYLKAHPGALRGNAKRSSAYKSVFLVQYINDKEG